MVSAVGGMLAGLAAVVSIGLVVWTGKLVRGQLSEAQFTRRQEILLNARGELQEPHIKAARALILSSTLPSVIDIYEDLGDRFRIRPQHQATYDAMNVVWTSFDKIGLLVNLGLLESEVACEISTTASACWTALSNHIEFERDKGRASHLVYFERLAIDSKNHWQTRNVSALPLPLRNFKK
jgi:hypothetical protein